MDHNKPDEEALRERIALLEEELRRVKEEKTTQEAKGEQRQGTPKRRLIIAADTPSPKRTKLDLFRDTAATATSNYKNNDMPPQVDRLPALPPVKPSNLLSKLSAMHQGKEKSSGEVAIKRSTGFNAPAPPPPASKRPQPDDSVKVPARQRDTNLRLIETLQPGPYTHHAPPNDPHFVFLEPHSGIRLSSRKLAHAEVEEHLRGRYFVSVSMLYSVVRPLAGNAGYEVPVEGDWMTMGVIVKRGEIGWTNSVSGEGEIVKKGKGKEKEEQGPRRKKYMSIKLVDFGTRCEGKEVRGDALLTMLLFEADKVTDGGKTYRGGSGGAFEACMKLHEGAVIAILNPKIMKPYKRDTSELHPTRNILAITPTSGECIAIIGESRDLGMCGAVRRDGKVCGDWCDRRVSEYCEYHVESAVRGKRVGRPEFSIGTSGLSKSAHVKKSFDAESKWGLMSEGSTYIFAGHVVGGGGPEYVEEKIGRGRAEQAKRRREARETDEMLNKQLGRARGEQGEQKRSYSAATVKLLGFDPSGKKTEKSADTKRKLEILDSLQRPDKVYLRRKSVCPSAKDPSSDSSDLEII